MSEDHDSISRYYFESITTKLERTIEKLWIMCIILIILLVGSNGAWLYYESQYTDAVTETTQIEAEQDGAGVNIIGGGNVNYGTTSENNAYKN